MAHRTSIACAALLLATAFSSVVHAGKIGDYRDEPDAWFASDEGKSILANVLAAQRANGVWWKNYDLAKPPFNTTGDEGRAIFDNMATIGELRLLGRAVRVTGDAKFRDAFDRGLALTLKAQYANGGWPQEYPAPTKGYAMQVTFNDDAMTRVLLFLKDVAEGKPDVAFVDADARARAKAAFDRGIDCVLASQVKIDGRPTVWCAQYDEKTLLPAKARAYELPSLSGGESAGITLMLMGIETPDGRVKSAVQDAVSWFDRAKLTGIRTEEAVERARGPGEGRRGRRRRPDGRAAVGPVLRPRDRQAVLLRPRWREEGDAGRDRARAADGLRVAPPVGQAGAGGVPRVGGEAGRAERDRGGAMSEAMFHACDGRSRVCTLTRQTLGPRLPTPRVCPSEEGGSARPALRRPTSLRSDVATTPCERNRTNRSCRLCEARRARNRPADLRNDRPGGAEAEVNARRSAEIRCLRRPFSSQGCR